MRGLLGVRICACLLVSVTILTAVAACTDGSGEPPDATRSSGPAADELASRIDLEGTALVPLHWRDPGGGVTDPEVARALLAARRYLALVNTWWWHPHPRDLIPLLPTVAYGNLLNADESSLRGEIERQVEARPSNLPERLAPLWLWVQQVRQETPTRVRVEVCVDDYWYEANFMTYTKPRNQFRGNMNTVWVEQVPDHGTRYWKVIHNYYDGNRPPATDETPPDPALRERCDAWTRGHTELPAKVPQDLFITRTP